MIPSPSPAAVKQFNASLTSTDSDDTPDVYPGLSGDANEDPFYILAVDAV